MIESGAWHRCGKFFQPLHQVLRRHKMYQKENSSESGQVLVFLVLAVVGLLAFTALAIDGGLIYVDRRGAQNAADASVLSGGYRIANSLEDYLMGFNINYGNWNCDQVQTIIDTWAIVEGSQQAAANGYPIEGGSSLEMTCEPGVDLGTYIDKYADSQAIIVSEVDTSFAHFAYGGLVQNTVEAVTRVRPRMPLAFGYAVYAHRDSCPNNNGGGVHFNGTNQVNITGGGVMSDACINAVGNINLHVNGGGINFITEYDDNGNTTVVPDPEQQTTPIPDWALLFSEPDCSGLPSASFDEDGNNSAGNYSGNITINGNDEATLDAGLYCFSGNVTINGGSFIGEHITIYMVSGDLTVSGNSVTQISAPNFVDNANDGITGMLIYVDEDNAGQVNLEGNGNSQFSGTIYASNQDSRVDIGGTSNAVFNTQIIAGTVFIHGNATLDVTFNDANMYALPARLTLER